MIPQQLTKREAKELEALNRKQQVDSKRRSELAMKQIKYSAFIMDIARN